LGSASYFTPNSSDSAVSCVFGAAGAEQRAQTPALADKFSHGFGFGIAGAAGHDVDRALPRLKFVHPVGRDHPAPQPAIVAQHVGQPHLRLHFGYMGARVDGGAVQFVLGCSF
jgi:hypothetical protein